MRRCPLGARASRPASGARARTEEAPPLKIALASPSTFLRSYVLKGGFRDGLAGLAIARFAAHHAFLKNLMLWELQNSPGGRPDSRRGAEERSKGP